MNKQQKKQDTKDSKTAHAAAHTRLAVIRIRGIQSIRIQIEDTMQYLRLYRKNFCAVVPNNEITQGMLRQAKDYVTWGEIDDETFNALVAKRGEEFKGREMDSKELITSNDFVTIHGKKYKKFFRLNAPKKGYGSKGIKTIYSNGGALGYRGAAINELIKRML